MRNRRRWALAVCASFWKPTSAPRCTTTERTDASRLPQPRGRRCDTVSAGSSARWCRGRGGCSPAAQALTALQETTRLRNTANRGSRRSKQRLDTAETVRLWREADIVTPRRTGARRSRSCACAPARGRGPSACRAKLPGWSRRPLKADRHLDRDPGLLVHQLRERLTGHAQPSGRLDQRSGSRSHRRHPLIGFQKAAHSQDRTAPATHRTSKPPTCAGCHRCYPQARIHRSHSLVSTCCYGKLVHREFAVSIKWRRAIVIRSRSSRKADGRKPDKCLVATS